MPVVGQGEHWAMSCGLNLASCRLRAEALARQLHASLWRDDDGRPRSASPSFGFVSTAALVIDKPAKYPNGGPPSPMSSFDGEDPTRRDAMDIVVTPPENMSPPFSPIKPVGEPHLSKEGQHLYDNGPPSTQVWVPESPPESFGSGSLQSDSPALTIETEERSTTSNSTETVSEIASPTFDISDIDKGSALVDELCSRLREIQSFQVNGTSMASPQEELTDTEDASCSTTLTESSQKRDSDYLSPEAACPRLIRSTSLKTGKTPPDTPNRKKIVRFADALGLDLEAVRHFVEDDDAVVPQSAFADLKVSPSSGPLPWAATLPGLSNTSCYFVPQFQQPASDVRFLDRVRQQKVCLENVISSDLRVTAVVRVLNLGYEKKLYVRYTTTEWAAFTDLLADYVPHSCDGFSDKFTFTINLPHLSPGQRLLFALKYVANGQEFWDNSKGNNYILRCQAKPLEPENGIAGPRWMHHFM